MLNSAAAEAIVVDLKAYPSKILPYALVAFDNQITEGEPVLEAIEEKIKNPNIGSHLRKAGLAEKGILENDASVKFKFPGWLLKYPSLTSQTNLWAANSGSSIGILILP